MKSSSPPPPSSPPSSSPPTPTASESALTSIRLDLPLNRKSSGANSEAPPSVDSFLSHLGDPGRFQIVVMFLLASNCIPVVVNHLLMAFYAVTAPHNCRVPEEFALNKSVLLPTKEGYESSSVSPLSHQAATEMYEECRMFANSSDRSAGTTRCLHGYEFHFDGTREWNIVSEWGLVCDRAFLAPLVTTVYFCGVMVGGVVFGSLSDRFGRKNMMLVCLYTQCLIGIGIHFVRRLVVFVGLRFVQGVFIQGLQCVTYSMVMELFSPRYRTLAGCVVEGFWAAGIILLAAIAKTVQHWRFIQLAINIPTLATIFYIWIIPESVRWLLSRGKLGRAEEIVVRIASYNSLRLDRTWLRHEMSAAARTLASQQEGGGAAAAAAAAGEAKGDLCDLVTNARIRKHAFVLFFVWFSVSLSYYGISFSIPNLSGDRYLNFMIGGGIELLAYLLAFVLLNAFGRKYPLACYLALSGVLCIATVTVGRFIPASVAYVDLDRVTIGLALVGKAAVVSCFCSIFIYTSELFPTVIRTVAVGACAFFGRVGSLLAPQILMAGQRLNASSPELVTFSTFGVLSLVAAFLTLLLPETLNKGLPDTVTQANRLGEGSDGDDSEDRRDSGVGVGGVGTGRRRRSKKRGSSLLGGGGGGGGGGGSEEAILDEVGYGKSPEWVEVDGLIVSRGALVQQATGSRTGFPGPPSGANYQQQQRQQQQQQQQFILSNHNHNSSTLSRGSEMSLPYSSGTLLTSSSRSTGTTTAGYGYSYDDARQHAGSNNGNFDGARDGDDGREDEPPYETLPNLEAEEEEVEEKLGRGQRSPAVVAAVDDFLRSRLEQPPPPPSRRLPPPPPPPLETHPEMLRRQSRSGEQLDDSVISAQASMVSAASAAAAAAADSDFKSLLRSRIFLEANLGDETRL